MMSIKNRYKLFAIALVMWSVFALVLFHNYKEYRVQNILNAKEELAYIKYNSAYRYYKLLSKNAFNYIINTKDTKRILNQIKSADKKQLNIVREQLYHHLKISYKSLNITGFRQFHFHLKDNTSFLRLHKPSKYGDSLTGIRYGVELTNKTLKFVEGFEEGRMINGFRFIYPLFDDDKNHLGSVELSVGSKGFIDVMQNIFEEDMHFLVKKSVVNRKTWPSERVKHYKDSAESSLYYIENFKELSKDTHYNSVVSNKDLTYEISQNIKKHNPFTLHFNKQIISFLPIENIKDEKVAYFVIYTNDEDIYNIMHIYWVLNIITVLFLVVFLYILYKDYMYKRLTKKSNKEIHLLNQTLEFRVKQKTKEQNILLSLFDIGDTVLFNWNNDENWSIKYVSLNVENLFGYTKKEFEDGSCDYSSLIDKGDLETVHSEVTREFKLSNEFIRHKPYKIITKDNQTKWVLDYTTILRDKNNKITNFIGLVSDITELKQKDEQILQQTKQAQMGDMIGMIAHQWRQPLNAISATGINMSLMSSMNMLEDKKVQESSEFIQEQCQKMSSTIDTFMNFVKPSKESKAFKLTHTVDAIMQIMGTQLANHNITVNIDATNKNISMIGYEDLLEQVIINLLSNSRDAFENLEIADKFINITIDMQNNIPIISIEDNAGGVPHAIQDKIFNPYFTTKEQGKGTGIGLYMSMDIMKKSFDGDLKYKATKGGSCFEIICGNS